MLVLLIFAVLGRSNAQNCFGQEGGPGVCVMREKCKGTFDGLKRQVLRGAFCIFLKFHVHSRAGDCPPKKVCCSNFEGSCGLRQGKHH